MSTRSGYPRAVRLWRRGELFEAAKTVFEIGDSSMSASGGLDRTVKPPRFVMAEHLSFFEYDLWLGQTLNSLARLDLPADAEKDTHGDWLLVKPRVDWVAGGATHPSDTLLAIRLSRFLGGARDFAVLFTPSDRRALEGFAWCGERLLLSILDDLKPVFERWTPSDSGWTHQRLTGLPEIGVIDIWPLDLDAAEGNGEVLISLQDPLTPSSLLTTNLTPDEIGAPALLRSTPANFDASRLVVTRHEATSIDGERIPYIQVGPAKANGDALVHMTGYGGFGVSERPYYRTAIGKLWLERGGVSVIANIRGGGEFGTRWHEAGRREKKRLSHDDFAAVAADLVARGVTTPTRIAAEGGSNGGILISNMLTRYPERFGALFCTIPLIDMRRYAKLLAGASWIDEYGDPDKAEDWAFLKDISAYHTAIPGQPYPPILIATSRRDDRVHPGHARKFASKLQELGYDAWFYEPPAGGHGYGKDNKERAAFTSLGLNFLWENIAKG
jgi:prolyl oligopeptidase